jgi:hypothetical protein
LGVVGADGGEGERDEPASDMPISDSSSVPAESVGEGGGVAHWAKAFWRKTKGFCWKPFWGPPGEDGGVRSSTGELNMGWAAPLADNAGRADDI